MKQNVDIETLRINIRDNVLFEALKVNSKCNLMGNQLRNLCEGGTCDCAMRSDELSFDIVELIADKL